MSEQQAAAGQQGNAEAEQQRPGGRRQGQDSQGRHGIGQQQQQAQTTPEPGNGGGQSRGGGPAFGAGADQPDQHRSADQTKRGPQQQAVPRQLGAQRQHQQGCEHGEAQAPVTSALAALAPGQGQTKRPEGKPGPASLEQLQQGRPRPAAMALDRTTHPGKPLAGPHRQGIGPPCHPVEAMPAQSRQQPQGQAQQQRPARELGLIRFQPAQGQDRQQQRQGGGGLEQQQQAGGQASHQGEHQVPVRAWFEALFEALTEALIEAQHGPPLQGHGHQQGAIQHGQTPMARQGHQGEGEGGGGQGRAPLGGAQPQLHQGQQGRQAGR